MARAGSPKVTWLLPTTPRPLPPLAWVQQNRRRRTTRVERDELREGRDERYRPTERHCARLPGPSHARELLQPGHWMASRGRSSGLVLHWRTCRRRLAPVVPAQPLIVNRRSGLIRPRPCSLMCTCESTTWTPRSRPCWPWAPRSSSINPTRTHAGSLPTPRATCSASAGHGRSNDGVSPGGQPWRRYFTGAVTASRSDRRELDAEQTALPIRRCNRPASPWTS
jgi:hypothetical protein